MNEMPKIGDNIGVPYAEGVTGRLELDYAELVNSAEQALSEVENLPLWVESPEDMAAVASIVVKLRDLAARCESHRKAEGEPYLRSKEAVDAFFMRRIKDPVVANGKILAARLDAYKQRQLAEERARREREAAEARKAQEAAQREREEAEAAARRARSFETQTARQIEAAAARVEADIAEAHAEDTALATMASSAALVRERFEGAERSGQVTMRKTPVVYIENLTQIDLEALRPYLKEEHVLMALRSWARATNYTQEMPGAVVTKRDATVVR